MTAKLKKNILSEENLEITHKLALYSVASKPKDHNNRFNFCENDLDPEVHAVAFIFNLFIRQIEQDLNVSFSRKEGGNHAI